MYTGALGQHFWTAAQEAMSFSNHLHLVEYVNYSVMGAVRSTLPRKSYTSLVE